MARVRTGAAAGVSPARTRHHDELGNNTNTTSSSNGWEEDPNRWQSEFTLLWLDLLEKHGHATDVAAQLAEQATMSSTTTNGFGTFSTEPQHQTDALRAATALQESMQSVSELLSNVEEIIRKRLIDDAPAPCACRTQAPPNSNSSTSAVRPLSQAKANSLDVYLRGAPLESEDPAFVNAVRGWDARGGPVHAKAPPSMVVLDGLELHDAMMRNNLRLVGMHSAPQPSSTVYHSSTSSAGSYSAPVHRQYAPASSHAHTGAVHRAPDAVDPRITPKRKLAALLPMTHSSSSSHTNSEQPSHKRQQQQHTDTASLAAAQRTVQKQIQSLHAERVLEFREGTHVGEYLVQWRGLAQPQWVARKLCGDQAKLLIDKFSRKRLSKLRRSGFKQRVARPATAAAATADTSWTSRMSSSPPEEDIFIVDKIVDHRLRYKKKQYLVKWDGYDSSENTWECATKLQADVADVVEAYERKLAAQREKQEQEQLRAGTDADVSARSLATRASAVAPPTTSTTTTTTTNVPSAISNDSSRARASSAHGDRRLDEPTKHAHEHAAADSDVEIVSDGDHESEDDDDDDEDRDSVGTGSDRSPVDADDDIVEIDGSDSEHADDDGNKNANSVEDENEED